MARALKKPKAIKRKVFEKDPDEQFVVVCKPFRQGQAGRWEPVDTNTVAEWLRRALGSKTNCVRAIYTLGTRAEVIVKIAAEEDLSKILGRHRWIDIMYPHNVEKVINEHHIQLANFFSDIYEYNFKYNGDPGSNDALYPRREWIVPGDTPPSDFPIVKEKYPAPTWIGVPKDDPRLSAIVLPIPEPLNKDAAVTVGPIAPVQSTEAKSSIDLQGEDRKPIIKGEKLDPSEADDIARSVLSRPPVRNEGEESKPKVEEPPLALIEALNLLQKAKPRLERAGSKILSESEPIAKQEEDQKPPPKELLDALATFLPPNPQAMRAADQKPPPIELLDALAAFLPSNAQATKPVVIKPEPRKDTDDVSIARQRGKRNAEDPVEINRREEDRSYKKPKREARY